MAMPFIAKAKNFFGIYALTPLERDLLAALSNEMTPEYREILDSQFSHFNVVRRLTKHIDAPNSHGFTNFHVVRFGKDISEEKQNRRFPTNETQEVLATANVNYNGGNIRIEFWIVKGVFFRIKYRSPQKVYYPPSDYRIEDVRILI